MRGNRTIKRDTAGYEAYESPNCDPLGEVGDRIVIHEERLRPIGALQDIAPTILGVLGVDKPKEMRGVDLRTL